MKTHRLFKVLVLGGAIVAGCGEAAPQTHTATPTTEATAGDTATTADSAETSTDTSTTEDAQAEAAGGVACW